MTVNNQMVELWRLRNTSLLQPLPGPLWPEVVVSDKGPIYGSKRNKLCQHHHHVTLPARISLTLSPHPSLSSITPGRSSRLHPVSAQNCWIKFLADHTAYAYSCEEVHRSMSLMNSSLLLRQCPACLVRLTWIVYVLGGMLNWIV